MVRPMVVFPDPLSPTRPRVSPRLILKETPSTACTCPTTRCNIKPLVKGKCILRSRTSTSVLLATSASAIYNSLRYLLSSFTCCFIDNGLHGVQPGLSSSLGIGLLFGIGHIYPAGLAMSSVSSNRIQWGHSTADIASEGTTRHERTPRRWFQ